MNIKAIQKQLSDFADERDWDQFHNPKNLAMALSVEASELVEIFQWLTPEQSDAVMSSGESEHVKEEMADIMIYLIRMADKLNVDLEKAVADKIIKNSEKHPSKSLASMEKHYFKAKPKKCPICKLNNILNIVYGFPDGESSKAESAGKLVLGGCQSKPDDPDWQCADCHTKLYKDQS